MQRFAEGASAPAAPKPRDRTHLARAIPFVLVHLTALGAFVLPFEPWHVGLAIGLYYLRMFGVTAGYHRYFSHRSYKTSRTFQFLLACLAMAGAQRGVL
jgi:stearoyl-CoA desaturase (delta-9 desaturase)